MDANNIPSNLAGAKSYIDVPILRQFPEGDPEDLSYSDLDELPDFLFDRRNTLTSLQLDHNILTVLPRNISLFIKLVNLDLSNNRLSYVSPEISNLRKIRTLTIKNNRLDNDSIPKELALMQSLEVVNVSGNRFTELPIQFTCLSNLKCLYIGANNLKTLPADIQQLQK